MTDMDRGMVMVLLVATGWRKEAERWYGKLAQLCHVELNAAPTEATKRILLG